MHVLSVLKYRFDFFFTSFFLYFSFFLEKLLTEKEQRLPVFFSG